MILKEPTITLQIEGCIDEYTILRVTSKCVVLCYKGQPVYMNHANFNFMLIHEEVNWRVAENNKEGKTFYFLV